MSWSAQQEAAIKAVKAWRQDPSRQIFRLFGYAGTGKTTIARALADEAQVRFMAFTGKAALVMQSKGCTEASTIHSAIYTLEDDWQGVPTFKLNRDGPVKDCALVVVDEVSMVGEELARDLLSFGKQVLVIGDPAQLPPVKDAGYFTNAEPDAMLTEVHRQARDNPIVQLSMQVRQGGRLDYCDHGACKIVRRDEINSEIVLAADQVLVGLNKTRTLYNRRMRALRGFTGDVPLESERLICLRNNRQKGLLNGGIWTVRNVLSATADCITMNVVPDDAGVTRNGAQVDVHPYFFQGKENTLPWHERREYDEFDFGYAVTVHKAQGSQWNNVVLFDESSAFREDRARWLYTGLTRAAHQITIVR